MNFRKQYEFTSRSLVNVNVNNKIGHKKKKAVVPQLIFKALNAGL